VPTDGSYPQPGRQKSCLAFMCSSMRTIAIRTLLAPPTDADRYRFPTGSSMLAAGLPRKSNATARTPWTSHKRILRAAALRVLPGTNLSGSVLLDTTQIVRRMLSSSTDLKSISQNLSAATSGLGRGALTSKLPGCEHTFHVLMMQRPRIHTPLTPVALILHCA
jgi:hypothetical protein